MQAAVNAVRSAGWRLSREHALPLTPIDTGYMRSNWKLYPIHDGIRLTNNTYYLPWVDNKGRHAGFTSRIAAHAAPLMRQELAKVRVTTGKVGGRDTLRLEYPHTLSAAARFDQAPERAAAAVNRQFTASLLRFGVSRLR